MGKGVSGAAASAAATVTETCATVAPPVAEEDHRLSDVCSDLAAGEQISLASIDLVDVADTSLSLDSEALLDDVRDDQRDLSALDEDEDEDASSEEPTLPAVAEDLTPPESTPPSGFPSFSTRPIDAPAVAETRVPLPLPLPLPDPVVPPPPTATVTAIEAATTALPAATDAAVPAG
eukprot:gene13016-15010_t